MLEELQKLLVIQDRDSRRLSLEKELKEIPELEARAKQHLNNDLAAVASLKKAIQENAIAIKNLQLDADTRRTSIERLKTQQFETKKNEEFTALGQEITRYTEQVDSIETEELELMEQADELKIKLTDAEQALSKTENLVNEELAGFTEKAKNCSAEITELQSERTKLSADVDESLFGLYERLLKSKDGLALAEVNGDQCGGCHMKLVKSTLATLRAHKSIANCENCNRILFE